MEAPNLLNRLATSPQSLTIDELRRLNDEYPYMPLAAIGLLRYHADSLDDNEVKRLRLHLAMICPDKVSLFNLVGDYADAFADLYPAEKVDEKISTDNAIDTFFANYGMADPAETALLERMIFNPVPDYAEVLLADADNVDDVPGIPAVPPVSHTEPAPTAVRKEAPPQPKAIIPVSEPTPAEDSLLSESLAKIFIKQGRYERAYEIISNLSLNYPKKSIYFADQLRFLQKLIKIKQAASGQQT